MKSLLFLTTLVFYPIFYPQENPEVMFDFWLGHWELSWDEGDGKQGHGTNRILKILDGKVIQENFEATKGQQTGFKGMSVSTYNPQSKRWHQAWVDNQGGYFNFEGEESDGKKIFQTLPVATNDGKIFQQRMVFYDIQPNSLTWDWESSLDGGKTWKLNWRIYYKRVDN